MSPATPGGRSTPAGGGRVRGGARANAKAALGSRASGPARVYRRRRHRVSPSRGLTLSAAALCDGSPGRETLFQSPGTRPTRSCTDACASMPIFFFPSRRSALRVIEPKVILLGVNLGGSIFTNPRSKTSMKSHPDPLLVSNLTAISMKQEIFDLFANRERRDVIG